MFIVFEGIDGSGKTTVSNKVAEKLRALGLSVEHLREGGKFASNVTQAIREFGRDARNFDLTPAAEFFLYVTRDVQLLDEMTIPALGKTDVVIADRFLYSAEVLGRHGRGLKEEWIRPVLNAAARGIVPDLVILVDIDPHIARARRRVAKILTIDKRSPSRKGLSGVGMQQRFRAGYREMAAAHSSTWFVIDNDQNLQTTVDKVFGLVADAAKIGVPTALEKARREAITEPHRIALPLVTPNDALAEFLQRIDKRAEREPHVAAYLLSGLFGAGVDERRRALCAKASATVVAALAGLTDPVSWELRETLAANEGWRVALSLRGFARDHARAVALRATLTKTVPVEVMVSLNGSDSEEAWTLRERLLAENPLGVITSLTRIGTPRAWLMREAWLKHAGRDAFTQYPQARALCQSIAGLDDERAWEWRKEARDEAPISVITSLRGLSSDKSWKWRARYLERAPKAVFDTIAELDDPRAWDMRESMAARCKEAIDSMVGLDGLRAWKLRLTNADLWPSTVVKSLGTLGTSAQGLQLIERQLRQYPTNISLLTHAAAIALGVYSVADSGLD